MATRETQVSSPHFGTHRGLRSQPFAHAARLEGVPLRLANAPNLTERRVLPMLPLCLEQRTQAPKPDSARFSATRSRAFSDKPVFVPLAPSLRSAADSPALLGDGEWPALSGPSPSVKFVLALDD
jgi:hypothetical protein